MRLLILSLLLFSFITSCSTTDSIDISSAEKAFQEAVSYEKDDRFEEALRRFDEIKNKFPYSQYAKESDLHIANIYFKKEEFVSAALAYSNFKYLYPSHPQIPYVSLQLALSYFNQLPSTIDRDLSKGPLAIQEFNLVIKKYPNTEYEKTALEKKKKTEDMLAKKQMYIADFYFKKEQFLSAFRRYSALTKMPADNNLTIKACRRAAISAFEVGETSSGVEFLNLLSKKSQSKDTENEIVALKKKYGIH